MTTKKKTKKKGGRKAPKEIVLSPQEAALMLGDLAQLSPEQRADYYLKVCKSLGLNPLTGPFGYVSMEGKMTLYAKKDCAEQLRKKHGVSITNLTGGIQGICYVVTATGRDKYGKVDSATGAIDVSGLRGKDYANAIMKCETKAKRRLTLSICGLSMPDITELEDGLRKKGDVEFLEAQIGVATVAGAAATPTKPVPPPQPAAKAPAPVQVQPKTQKEKSMYDVYNGLNAALKSELNKAGYTSPYQCYMAWKEVEGDLDALFQLCQEKIKAKVKA